MRIETVCHRCNTPIVKNIDPKYIRKNGRTKYCVYCTACMDEIKSGSRARKAADLKNMHAQAMGQPRRLSAAEIAELSNVYQPPIGRKDPAYHLRCDL